MKKHYPIIIEKPKSKTEAWGISFPDLKGCFSAADSESEILDKAREAAIFHLEALDKFPVSSSILSIKRKYPKALVLLVDVDLSLLEGKSKRINITIKEPLLMRVDKEAKQKGQSRSEYLAEAALAYIA